MSIVERIWIMALSAMRHLANLVQKILLRALVGYKNESSVGSFDTRTNEVSVRIVSIALVVKPARHGSRS